MQCASYLFLKRKYEFDRMLMGETISYYCRCGNPYQVRNFGKFLHMKVIETNSFYLLVATVS